MKKYFDEHGNILTEADLKKSYEHLKKTDQTEANSFDDYLQNCLEEDGSLTEDKTDIFCDMLLKLQADENFYFRLAYDHKGYLFAIVESWEDEEKIENYIDENLSYDEQADFDKQVYVKIEEK